LCRSVLHIHNESVVVAPSIYFEITIAVKTIGLAGVLSVVYFISIRWPSGMADSKAFTWLAKWKASKLTTIWDK
jgi:hypothetical protein